MGLFRVWWGMGQQWLRAISVHHRGSYNHQLREFIWTSMGLCRRECLRDLGVLVDFLLIILLVMVKFKVECKQRVLR